MMSEWDSRKHTNWYVCSECGYTGLINADGSNDNKATEPHAVVIKDEKGNELIMVPGGCVRCGEPGYEIYPETIDNELKWNLCIVIDETVYDGVFNTYKEARELGEYCLTHIDELKKF